MNRTITLIIILVVAATSANAGEGVKRLIFVNAGADCHLNKGDVTHNTNLSNPMSAANFVGGRIGAELFWQLPGHLFFATGVDFRATRQKLNVNYIAAEAGFTGSSIEHSEEIRYPNSYIDPFARMGYSFSSAKKNNLDISLGIITSIPLSGQVEDGITAINITDPVYTDIIIHTNQSWGNQPNDNSLPVNALISLQIAYRLSIGKNQLRVGMDFSSGASRQINRTEVYYFGPGRTQAGYSVFADRFQFAGLFVGISL